jgi:leucyl-tRNA synthetase
MYDWAREIDTSRPEYYRWTQWVFLKLHERGLVYRRKSPVNWCPGCKTVLANDQVVDGRCWRCDSEVTKRDLEQWFVRITAYAERLLEGLDRIDWPSETKTTQRNWIGKSEGAEIHFAIEGIEDGVTVFTTRPDTLFGATYLVLAPEHPLVAVVTRTDRRGAVEEYVAAARRASETERTFADRKKTGVETGAFARHPLSGEKLPIWIADYVLPGYGTGAIMAVPAHDERDGEFAGEYGLPVRPVIRGADGTDVGTGPGVMFASAEFDGLSSDEGGRAVIARLERRGLGRASITYRMRDWCISRQRYWGAPIPMIHCLACGAVPVAEKDLPVLLPEQVDFRPTGTGESPLAAVASFVACRCPRCGGAARRETDTMDTFADSSWYFLRYPSAGRDDVAFEPEVANRWLPVDMYVGGPEHSRGHLIFARFVNMVLHDLGYVAFDEPFTALRHQGLITHHGAKMSKSKGNAVVPDDYIRQYGADALRLYLMFMGSYEQGGDWSDQGIHGVSRWINRVWRQIADLRNPAGSEDGEDQGEDRRTAEEAARALTHRLHATVDAVTRDLERMSYNTAIARHMELVNELARFRRRAETPAEHKLVRDSAETFVRLFAPFAPHLGEELWERLGHAESVFSAGWPVADPAALALERITVVIQIDGRLRSRVEVSPHLGEDGLKAAAMADERVRESLKGRTIQRAVVVPGRLVNFVTARVEAP